MSVAQSHDQSIKQMANNWVRFRMERPWDSHNVKNSEYIPHHELDRIRPRQLLGDELIEMIRRITSRSDVVRVYVQVYSHRDDYIAVQFVEGTSFEMILDVNHQIERLNYINSSN